MPFYMKRHWNSNDFVLTSEYLKPAELHADGTGYGVQKGYCHKCKSDMQRFLVAFQNGVATWGPLRHYNSHKLVRGIN